MNEYEKWLEEHQPNEESKWTDHSTYWDVIVFPILAAVVAIAVGTTAVLLLDLLFKL